MAFLPFKSTFRLQKRQTGLSIVNTLGIVLGYSCFFLILTYTWHEKSFDGFHKNSANLYRLSYSRYDQGTLEYNTANTFYPCGRYLKENCPVVANYTTIARNYNITVSFNNSVGQPVFFNEDKSYFAPASFLSLFSFPLINGSAAALDAPGKVIITDAIAKKYFNNQDPIGRVIRVNGTAAYEIAGVLKDLPANTHLKFDFLFSMPTHLKELGNGIFNNWGYDLFYTYLQLRPGTSPAAVEKMLPQMVEKNYGRELAASKEADFFKIQAVTDIHLHSNLEWETEKPGNGDAVNILTYFSIFVLLITWINQINLLSAQAIERAKEVGIRKTLGGSRWSIVWQFSAETTVVNIFSITIAACLLAAAYFLAGPSAVFSTEVYKSLNFWLVISAALLSGMVLTGLLPSLFLSGFKPVHVLKGKLAHNFEGLFLRKALIGFQFIVSFVLITGSLIVYNQGVFLMTKDRGLDNTSVIAIKFPKIPMSADEAREKSLVFKNEAGRLPWVKRFTMATDMPEHEIETFGGMYRPEAGSKDLKYYFRIGADENYFSFFKVKLLAGRFFSKDRLTDGSSSLILNEGAVKKLGYDNPLQVIGKIVKDDGGNQKTIIGVVKDFHYRSVKVKPVATMFNLQQDGLSYFGIKLKADSANSKEQVAELQRIYSNLFPGNPFDYFYLQDAMKKDLEADLDFARVFTLFSGMSVIISLTGLLGLVTVNLKQRVKELGVRKVIGASFNNIFLLVFKTMTAPLAIALLIGIPVSVWGFSAWIAKYYIYHIPISWYYFIVPAILLPLVSAMVIVVQVIKAYNQNIIRSLKCE